MEITPLKTKTKQKTFRFLQTFLRLLDSLNLPSFICFLFRGTDKAIF